MIAPLPVRTRLIGGEGLPTYRTRHAANNLTTVADVERYVEEQSGQRLSKSSRHAKVLQAWRELGSLHQRAFTEPQVVSGNWFIDRDLCERCVPPYEGAHGRLPWVGWVCLKHKRWIKDDEQTDLCRFGEALVAERHWRGRLTPRGVVVDSPLLLLAEEAATVGISKTVLKERAERVNSPSPGLLVYPETVKLARLLSRPSLLDAVLGDATPRWKRALVEREVRTILPDAKDAENWRAVARVWDMVLDLQDVLRDAQWLGHTPEDRWNVLRYSRLAQAEHLGVPSVHQVM